MTTRVRLGIALAFLLVASPLPAQEPKLLATLRGHTKDVRYVTISPDGKTLASGGADNSIRLWDVESGKERVALENAAEFWVDSVAFSPDGKTLAAGLGGNTIKLWDIGTRKGSTLLELGSQFASPLVVFSPDGKTLASGGRCILEIRLFDVAGGKQTAILKGNDVYGVKALAFAPDGKTLTSVGINVGIKRWDVAVGKEKPFALGAGEKKRVEKLIGDLGDAAFAEREKATREIEAVGPLALDLLEQATAHPNAEARIRVTRLIKRLEATTVEAQSITAAAFSPDGKTLAAGTGHNEVKLWDVTTSKEQVTFNGRVTAPVRYVVFSPDGKTLAAGSEDGSINLWDVRTGKQRAAVKGHAGAVLCLAFSADGKVIASGSKDKTIKLWDVATTK
jgi:WD40 repeat protein